MSGSGEFLTYFPKVMSAFEIPTVSLTSEENGRCLNTVHGKHTFTITTMEIVFWRQSTNIHVQQLIWMRWGEIHLQNMTARGEGMWIGPEQMSSLTECCLCNIFKVEILGLTERLNSLRQRERGVSCSFVRERERGRLPDGKGDGGEKDGRANWRGEEKEKMEEAEEEGQRREKITLVMRGKQEKKKKKKREEWVKQMQRFLQQSGRTVRVRALGVLGQVCAADWN